MLKSTDESLAHMLTHLCAAMRKANVDKTEAEYYGKGDSGDAFEVYSSSESNVKVPIQEKELSIDEAMGVLSEDIIDRFHSGYENNDGGGGTLVCLSGGLIELSAHYVGIKEHYSSYSEAVTDGPTECVRPQEINQLRVMDALESLDIEYVEVEYSGGGDSGGVDEVHFSEKDAERAKAATCSILFRTMVRNPDGKYEETWNAETLSLHDAIRVVAEDFIISHFRGFENNEGGCGQVNFNIDSKAISISHTDYEESYNNFSVALIDPACSDFQMLKLMDEHAISPGDCHPLSQRQSDLILRLKNEDIKTLILAQNDVAKDGDGVAPENASDEDLQAPQA